MFSKIIRRLKCKDHRYKVIKWNATIDNDATEVLAWCSRCGKKKKMSVVEFDDLVKKGNAVN